MTVLLLPNEQTRVRDTVRIYSRTEFYLIKSDNDDSQSRSSPVSSVCPFFVMGTG